VPSLQTAPVLFKEEESHVVDPSESSHEKESKTTSNSMSFMWLLISVQK